MKGDLRSELPGLSELERERLAARYRAFAEAAAALRELVDEQTEPCWAAALEVVS